MNIPLLNLIIQPLLGAAAGYITNEYAINMLFKTYTPLKLGGIIPKTREAFIENVSTLVEEDIINKEKIEAILNDESFTKNFNSLINDFFTKSIYEVTDNLNISENPFTYSMLSDTEALINEQIKLKIPELIDFLSEEISLCNILDKSQINIIIEKLFNYLLNITKDSKLADKLALNIINNNENTSLMDIIGYDVSAIISKNISDILIENFSYRKSSDSSTKADDSSSNFQAINFLINEIFEKTNISNLLFEFLKKFTAEKEDKLRDKISSILSNITKSYEFTELISVFSQKLISYGKSLDIPLLKLMDEACINNFRDILYSESVEMSDIIISFANSNKFGLQNLLEEAIVETINEQDSAKKAILSMAKGSILNSISKNDISELISEYFKNSNNRLNLCSLASMKLKEYLQSTTVSEAINILEEKEVLSAETLKEFLFTYISSNSKDFSDKILVFIKNQINDESIEKNIRFKLQDAFINKIILSSKTKDFLNNQLSIYLTKLFDKNLREILQHNFMTSDNENEYALNFNDNICNYLEQNRTRIIETLSVALDSAVENKSLNELLNNDFLSNSEANNNFIIVEILQKKISEQKEKIAKKSTYELYDKLNRIDDLHENSSKLLKNAVINNLDSLLHKFVKGMSVKNLSQLDDDNLVKMAQSFIGNNLKPIMLFGGMLGFIAGLILAFLQPNNNVFALVSIGGTFTCALVGYLTNAIAIAMLFRPYEEIRILRHIPFFRHFSLGYIAKNKANLAEGMSQTISEYLLTKDSMNELIDTYKDSIKEALLSNISKDNYELLSNLFVNNKDKIAGSLYDYALKALNNNKRNISEAIVRELEKIKANDFVYKFENNISEYIINSKPYFNALVFKYLSDITTSGHFDSSGVKSKTIRSILPKSTMNSINKFAKIGFYGAYDKVISYVDIENIHKFAVGYDENYQKLISKNLSEILPIESLFSTDNAWKIINKYKNLNSPKKIGEVFDKKIATLLNNLLYSFFNDIGVNSHKLIKPIKPHISKIVKEKITSNFNFLAKVSYNMMGGDKIIDSVIEKVLSDKLPKLMLNKKDELYDSCSNYLNSKLLNLNISEFGISFNFDIIANSSAYNINDVISPISDFANEKAACIKIKKLLETLSFDSIDAIFSSYNREISALVESLSSKLSFNKDNIISYVNMLIEKYIGKLMDNTSINQLLKSISSDDLKNVSDNIINILFKESLISKSTQDILESIRDYGRELYVSELIDKDNFIEKFEKTIDCLFDERVLESPYKKMADKDTNVQLLFTKTIDDVLSATSKDGFAFINNESKEYLLNKVSDAAILSLRNNLSTMLNDIEFDEIAKEQINSMSARKIHLMFNSFAGKYFRTLIIYGLWGAVFGINTIAGLALAAVYGLKNLIKK